MFDRLLSVNDQFLRFVVQAPLPEKARVFVPAGLVTGLFAAWWSARLISRESAGARRLSVWWGLAIVVGTASLDFLLLAAVIHWGAHGLTEAGSVDWAHWRLIYHYVLIGLLVTATAIDFDQYLIPDAITVPGMLVGVIAATLVGHLHLMPVWIDWNQEHPFFGPYIPQWIKDHPHWHGLSFSLAGLLAGAIITWLARLVSHWAIGREALGFGDVTLMGMIGSFLGWQPTVCVFLLAPACGVLIGLTTSLLYGRRAIAYGPYLAAAAYVVLCSWRWIWIPTRDVFGHVPTLSGLVVVVIGGLALLLRLARAYRSIPVTGRYASKTQPAASASTTAEPEANLPPNAEVLLPEDPPQSPP